MQTEIERIAANLVRNEVHLCLSSMVATLAIGPQRTLYDRDTDSRGRPVRRDDLAELCEQAADLCAPLDDWEEAAIQAGWKQHIATSGWYLPGEGPEPDSEVDTAAEACDESGIEPYQREIFEHWAVSQRLAEDLQSLGERVDTDFAGLCVWGRTTTGQMIEMDSIMLQVAQLVHDRAATLSTAADNARQPDGSISASRFLANADHIERRT